MYRASGGATKLCPGIVVDAAHMTLSGWRYWARSREVLLEALETKNLAWKEGRRQQ